MASPNTNESGPGESPAEAVPSTQTATPGPAPEESSARPVLPTQTATPEPATGPGESLAEGGQEENAGTVTCTSDADEGEAEDMEEEEMEEEGMEEEEMEEEEMVARGEAGGEDEVDYGADEQAEPKIEIVDPVKKEPPADADREVEDPGGSSGGQTIKGCLQQARARLSQEDQTRVRLTPAPPKHVELTAAPLQDVTLTPRHQVQAGRLQEQQQREQGQQEEEQEEPEEEEQEEEEQEEEEQEEKEEEVEE